MSIIQKLSAHDWPGRGWACLSRQRWRAFRGTWIAALTAVAVTVSACSDLTRPSITPVVPKGPMGQKSLLCNVSVKTKELSCSDVPTVTGIPSAVRANRIVGGQDMYVKLSSSGTSYDAGTQIFSTDVTVQSLMQTVIGTTDGSTISGVTVFLAADPAVTAGAGTVTVANPSGTGTFTASNQSYFLYSEILEPYQISASHHWQFVVPNSVDNFQFVVYVSAPMVDDNVALVDAVWNGLSSSDWLSTGNWRSNSAPGDMSVVAIPRASLLDPAANQPSLSADDIVSDLRVGEGSTLSLNGHRLEITRNLDAPGAVTGGTVSLTGSTAIIGGNVPALEVHGAARMQRPVVASGPIAITESLTIGESTLTIDIP